MAADRKIVLHACAPSSCVWRVRLVLDYKEIPYEYKSWNLLKGEHHSEEYKKISPLEKVPSLEIDGVALIDSMAIIEYLEERFPDRKPLLPKDLKKRAAIRSVAYIITSGIQPLQIPSHGTDELMDNATTEDEDARLEWPQKWIVSGFNVVESILKTTAGKYSFGDELTYADIVLVPQIGNAHRYKLNMEQFPTLQRVCDNLYKLEFIKNSTPNRQPDYGLYSRS